MTTGNQQPSNQDSEGDKLYAGKFKTVEELEAGYKSSLPTFQENETLKKKVEELTSVPSDYLNPADVELEESRVNDIKARAKEAGLTQEQYNKMVLGDKSRVERNKQNFESARKEVGEETLNLLQDYVNKHYPKELTENMMRTFIGNKEARQAALNHRNQLLNNQVPGVNRVAAGGYSVTQADINKAHAAKEKNPGDMKARQHYINLLATKAEQDGSR
jgi:hypothetical protein